jgi:DNA-directed RNA polymerase subunit RPC12/RpoP
MIHLEKELIYKLKPKECPKCGSKSLARLAYGNPVMCDRLKEEIKSGKTVLGGCRVSELDPVWICTKCETKFYCEEDYIRLKEIDNYSPIKKFFFKLWN